MTSREPSFPNPTSVERLLTLVLVVVLWSVTIYVWFRDGAWHDPVGVVLIFTVPLIATWAFAEFVRGRL